MSPTSAEIQTIIQAAYQALLSGDRRKARRLAQQAASMAPDQEEPWLILAAVGTPEASLEYLNKALEINPQSQQARQGMHWAIRRLRAEPQKPIRSKQIIVEQPSPASLTRTRPILAISLIPLLIVLIIIVGGFFLWYGTPTISQGSKVVSRTAGWIEPGTGQ